MTDLDLPPHLVSELESGNVVLMLGAGASLGATNSEGKHPPKAWELADVLAKKFLPSGYEKLPLNQVAEYAINETSLFTVQDFLAEYFGSFQDTPAHKLLTTFRWRGIATTNYDTLVEQAYRDPKAIQTIVPIIDNSDKFDEKVRDKNDLLYLKLHGCITRTRNPQCPLILSTDQYVSYAKGRKRVFDKFKEWGSERSILFVGHGLQDQNIRQMLEEISNEVASRQRYYFVSPEVTDIDRRLWEGKKITAIAGTFDDLFSTLDSKIGAIFRGLRPTTAVGAEGIKERFVKSSFSISKNALRFLENDVDYVKCVKATETIDPKLFYRGASVEWSAIEQNLDARRHLMDTILVDYFLGQEDASEPNMQMIVVKAEAGAGKTVLLQRLAWDATHDYGKLCLFVRPEGRINTAAISELAELTNETIYLFLDTALDRQGEIAQLFAKASSIKGRVTVVTAARKNEWNIAPDAFTSLASEEYGLPYLSKSEINELLKLLETHKALGHLVELSPQQREDELHERAGRQLLVALHEATFGESFELIIADEYKRITPDAAREMYLTVCLLNQYGVPVRAGIISRMYNLPFEEFRKSFFAPLEQIIITRKDKISNDYCYSARHPHIAEIVVRNELNDREDLFNMIMRTIQFLNPSYKSDQTAFRRLIQGRYLLETFPNHEMVVQIYDAARRVVGDDPSLLQQMAIYEMHRDKGNLSHAEKLVRKALELSTNSRTIQHTLAELFVKRAEDTHLALEREKYLTEASEICHDLKGKMQEAYPYYTLVKIGTIRIREALGREGVHDQTIENLIRSTEKELTEGEARYPENAPLRKAEAELATTLEKSDRAIAALRKAFDLNHRNIFVAMRLASCYVSKGDLAEATSVLKNALNAKRGDAKLNYFYGKLLLDQKKGSPEEIVYHLERGYVPGDSNYDAQFLHARQLFVIGKREESKALFLRLRRAYISPFLRHLLRYRLEETFTGTVQRMEVSYCRVSRDGDGEWIYVGRDRVAEDVWNTLSIGTRVSFEIGFTMHGPAADHLARI